MASRTDVTDAIHSGHSSFVVVIHEPSPIQFAIVKLSDWTRERCPAVFVAVISTV